MLISTNFVLFQIFAISWCFSEDSAIPSEQLAGSGGRIIYHRGIPDFEKASNGPRLVVLDDPLNEA